MGLSLSAAPTMSAEDPGEAEKRRPLRRGAGWPPSAASIRPKRPDPPRLDENGVISVIMAAGFGSTNSVLQPAGVSPAPAGVPLCIDDFETIPPAGAV